MFYRGAIALCDYRVPVFWLKSQAFLWAKEHRDGSGVGRPRPRGPRQEGRCQVTDEGKPKEVDLMKALDISLHPPRCGDTVFHRPTGETWVVAYAEGEYLAWFGWPDGLAKLSDCEVKERCSDEEHAKAVDEERVRRLAEDIASIHAPLGSRGPLWREHVAEITRRITALFARDSCQVSEPGRDSPLPIGRDPS